MAILTIEQTKPTIPFLSLSVGGYFWAATSKFWFEYQNKQAFEKARQVQLEAAP